MYIYIYIYIYTVGGAPTRCQVRDRLRRRTLTLRLTSRGMGRSGGDDTFPVSFGELCLCVSSVGPLCGPPLRWWVLCGALPSVWVPCLGPLCGSPLCGSPLRGSPVGVPCVGPSTRRVASCGIYSRDVSRSFTRSRLNYALYIESCALLCDVS